MMYSKLIKNTLYVYRNGVLIYKRWVDTGNSVLFNTPRNWNKDKTVSIR